jgi:Zn-dependent protease
MSEPAGPPRRTGGPGGLNGSGRPGGPRGAGLGGFGVARSGGISAGRIAGVPFVIAPSWFLAAVFLTVLYAPSLRDPQLVSGISLPVSYLLAFALVLLLYAGVLLHELSHVLVAKALGMPVGRVVLQLLGGVSEILEEPETAGREYLVAAVGPLASLLLVGVAAGLLPLFEPHTIPWLLTWGMLGTNAAIAVFNLLPGLPLDGGRVARALIWQLTHNKLKATIVAAWIGRGIAVALAVVGVAMPGEVFGRSTFAVFYAVLLAMFMWSNAGVAIAQAKLAAALPNLDTRALLRRALPVDAQLPVAEAIRRAHAAQARALVVVDGAGRPQGLVSESAVMELPEQRRPWTSISELSRPLTQDLVVREGITGEGLLKLLQTAPATEYLVVADTGAIRGVLSRLDIANALRAAGLR